ncbi:ATP synthase protein [Gracilaria domingensis]|nr:ATP synthase protein [Gracilaria domingensis]
MSCAFVHVTAVSSEKVSSWARGLKINVRGVPRTVRSQTNRGRSRQTVRANSLEDSKRRAKSQYDNIPDLNQQYLAELSWAERKYGPQRISKDIAKEAQGSILRSDRQSTSKRSDATKKAEVDRAGGDSEADLTQYKALRNKLLGDTLFVGALGLCAIWAFGGMKDVQSFAVGLGGSIARCGQPATGTYRPSGAACDRVGEELAIPVGNPRAGGLLLVQGGGAGSAADRRGF